MKVDNLFGDLKMKLLQLNKSPVFFIGTGLSIRYFQAPSWEGLLKEVRNDWDRNYLYYLQKYINNDQSYNYEKLATVLQDMYFEKMSDEQLERGKNKNYYFKKRIAEIVVDCFEAKEEVIWNNSEIKELRKTSPSAIITTNYDTLLENVFKEYTVYRGQEEILTNVIDGVGDIYKIHGCVTKPESIVITEEDYDNFFKKAVYLNSKLITLFLEYPIIFIGYSLSDRNIKSILSTIIKSLPIDKVEEFKQTIWFLRKNDTNEDFKKEEIINLGDGLSINITCYYLKDFSRFYKIINDKSIKKLPIKFIKYLKKNLYEVISTQKYDPDVINVNLTDLEKIKSIEDYKRIVGITIDKRSETKISVLSNKEIKDLFITRNKNKLAEFAIIDYCLTHIREKVPMYYFIKDRSIKEIIKYIDSKQDIKEENRNKLKENLKDTKKDIYINYIGNIYEFKENEIEQICLETNKIDEYIENIRESKGIRSNSPIPAQLFLKLLEIRIEELVSKKYIIKNYKEDIIISLSNLDEKIICSKAKEIFYILNVLKDECENDTKLRRTLCYIDIILYKKF